MLIFSDLLSPWRSFPRCVLLCKRHSRNIRPLALALQIGFRTGKHVITKQFGFMPPRFPSSVNGDCVVLAVPLAVPFWSRCPFLEQLSLSARVRWASVVRHDGPERHDVTCAQK